MATGAAIGSAVVGIAGNRSASKSADASAQSAQDSLSQGIAEMEKYFEQANIHGEDALQFSQDMLGDWEDTFGGIEENLSSYYQNLDPAKYSQQYKTNLNENIDKELTQMNESMAASGLQTAGMKQQTAKEAAFAKAQGGAESDLMAEDKVRGMQQGFLNTGANQKSAANSSITNSYGNLANINMSAANSIGGMYGAQSGLSQGQSNQSASDAAGFMKGGMEGLSGALTGLFG